MGHFCHVCDYGVKPLREWFSANDISDTLLSCSLNEPRCSSLPSSPAKRVSPAKKKQFFINQAIRNSDLTPRAKGKKSMRRQENSTFCFHFWRLPYIIHVSLFTALFIIYYTGNVWKWKFHHQQKWKFHHQPPVISNLLLTSVKHMRRSLAECSHCSLFLFPIWWN